ncbi:MAG: hypothetical protein WAM61_13740 [Desulfobacterales bacterium]
MPYIRDDVTLFDSGDEELFESLLEDDEEKWEDPEWATEAALPRYRRGATRLPLPARRPFRPIGGATGASIQTPAGRAQVHFPKPVATQEAVNALARELKGEIAGLTASIKKVNQTLDQNTSIVDKKINAVSVNLKKTGEMSPMMLLPMLLTKNPTLTNLTLKPLDALGNPIETADFSAGPVNFKVDSQAVTQDNSTLPLLLMMMMGGGLGGSGGSESTNMMMMVLLLTGGFGK